MDGFQIILTSAVVAAIVGPVATFLSQRRLADQQAKIDYELAARIRLYEAIGSLRFQLLIAARDVVRRFALHHRSQWNMEPDAYYVSSSLYRILRPLAIGELIERQMSFADFSVDDDAIPLLRFQTAAYRMLVGEDPVQGHPGLDWSSESQHVFRDNLGAAAARLIDLDADGRSFVIAYSEFAANFPDPRRDASLRPLAAIFDHCESNLTENPVFWARIVAYSYVCNWLLGALGSGLGFGVRAIDVEDMIHGVDDDYITSHASVARQWYDTTIAEDL